MRDRDHFVEVRIVVDLSRRVAAQQAQLDRAKYGSTHRLSQCDHGWHIRRCSRCATAVPSIARWVAATQRLQDIAMDRLIRP